MIFTEILNPFLLNLACFLFASFSVCFILPDTIMALGYLLPISVGHIKRKEIRIEGLWALLRKPLILLCLALLLVGLVYLANPPTGTALMTSTPSLFCWLASIPILIFVAVFRRSTYLDFFYMNIFMEFATPIEQARYARFIERLDTMPLAEAASALEDQGLTYLEKKALEQRILMLEESQN
ncbi:MAG: hypothetical protein ACOYD7_05970 [Raoultibacter sp.]|jgi:hypothetical protein